MILQPDDVSPNSDEDKHVIMTLQPRVPAGSLTFAELPAGMLDGGTFSGSAAKEISEETGLEVPGDQLVDMTELALSSTESSHSNEEKLQRAVYPSAGGSDEYIPLMLYQKRIGRKEMEGFKGKLTGLRDEGEKITLKLVRLEDLWKEGARDAKALCAWALYEGLRKEGKV